MNVTSLYELREDRGDYDANDEDGIEPLDRAQGLVGEAWNLAGLLLKSLDDESDERAMQIHTAVRVIEKKLEEAWGQIGRLIDAETR